MFFSLRPQSVEAIGSFSHGTVGGAEGACNWHMCLKLEQLSLVVLELYSGFKCPLPLWPLLIFHFAAGAIHEAGVRAAMLKS